MRRFLKNLPLLGLLFISGCGFIHDKEITGPYRLIAVDLIEEMSICYNLGNGDAVGRIEGTVFAYGFDQQFIVAKQHPANDRTITRYFYLDMTLDSKHADPSASVTGPLDRPAFEEARLRLKLPPFSCTIDQLK
ncbi:hypothetical protein [Luteolibacter sp. AS25]|uniref:hypothetical protein n=1 Tax=Luteolibacter sp. AS25 TaxID=3135776 RepID=UPI00398A8D9B